MKPNENLLIRCLLFVFISSAIYATSAGVTSSNDGSHYALLRALADEGRFRIETYAHFAEGNDLSIREGAIFSDRPPGTALAGLPFDALGRLIGWAPAPMPTRHDEGSPALPYLLLMPALCIAGVAVIIYDLLRQAEISQLAALGAALAYGLGSTAFKYGGVIFSHAVSALLIALAAWLVMRISRGEVAPAPAHLSLLGLLLGSSVVVEYSNGLYALIVTGWLMALRGRGWGWHPAGKALLWLALGALPVVIFLAYYNTVNFGGPLTTSYAYAVNYPWAASLRTTFDVPLAQGLIGMLWYGIDARQEINQGLFLLMPAALIGLAGVRPYIRRRPAEAALTLGTFALFLLLFSMHHTFSGFTADGRYLMPFLALWFVAAGWGLQAALDVKSEVLRAALLIGAAALIALSVRNMLAHVAFSYNYHLEPGLLARRAATPQNWAYLLNSIFVNWRNLPVLWAALAISAALWALLARLKAQQGGKVAASLGQASE